MDKQELMKNFKVIDQSVQQETGMNTVSLAVNTAIILRLLYKAMRAKKRGNYGEALFYLLYWHSVKSSTNDLVLRHTVKRGLPKEHTFR